MMQSRAVRFGQSDQVVVAAVRRVHEGDDRPGAVRQVEPQGVAEEHECLIHVAGEQQDVREIERVDLAHLAARGRAAVGRVSGAGGGRVFARGGL